jgi:linoleoyl-CoA desaturase
MARMTKPAFMRYADSELFQQLRREVNTTVRQLERKRKPHIVLKAILFPALYIIFYLAALKWGYQSSLFYTFYFLMGILLVLNFLNLIHEAVHNTLFQSRAINNWYVHFFDLMGANSLYLENASYTPPS